VFEEVKMEDWAIGGSLLGWRLYQSIKKAPIGAFFVQKT
jgi:hypothetical protein